uniref:Uncharacterized protein n=1 Tax=Strongyloides papillosus TaxID=174720 RepID=A0A0N5BQY5_STREA
MAKFISRNNDYRNRSIHSCDSGYTSGSEDNTSGNINLSVNSIVTRLESILINRGISKNGQKRKLKKANKKSRK